MSQKVPRNHYIALSHRWRRVRRQTQTQNPLYKALGVIGLLAVSVGAGVAAKMLGARRVRRIIMFVSFGRRIWQHCQTAPESVNNLNKDKAMAMQNSQNY